MLNNLPYTFSAYSLKLYATIVACRCNIVVSYHIFPPFACQECFITLNMGQVPQVFTGVAPTFPPCFSFRSLCCTLPSISFTQPPLLWFIILCKFIGTCIKTIWTEGQITSTLWTKRILATWYSKSNFPPIHCVSTWIRFHQESSLRTNYPLCSSPNFFWPCVLEWCVTWMKMYISVW